jgi:hypothetical protein
MEERFVPVAGYFGINRAKCKVIKDYKGQILKYALNRHLIEEYENEGRWGLQDYNDD